LETAFVIICSFATLAFVDEYNVVRNAAFSEICTSEIPNKDTRLAAVDHHLIASAPSLASIGDHDYCEW